MINNILLAIVIFLSNIVFAASFNCEKATRPLEKSICADEQLSRLDEQMADYFFNLKNTL